MASAPAEGSAQGSALQLLTCDAASLMRSMGPPGSFRDIARGHAAVRRKEEASEDEAGRGRGGSYGVGEQEMLSEKTRVKVAGAAVPCIERYGAALATARSRGSSIAAGMQSLQLVHGAVGVGKGGRGSDRVRDMEGILVLENVSFDFDNEDDFGSDEDEVIDEGDVVVDHDHDNDDDDEDDVEGEDVDDGDVDEDMGWGEGKRGRMAEEEAALEEKLVAIITGGKWDALSPNSGRVVAVGEHQVCVGYREDFVSGYRTWEWQGHLTVYDDEEGFTSEYVYGNHFEALERYGDLVEEEGEKWDEGEEGRGESVGEEGGDAYANRRGLGTGGRGGERGKGREGEDLGERRKERGVLRVEGVLGLGFVPRGLGPGGGLPVIEGGVGRARRRRE